MFIIIITAIMFIIITTNMFIITIMSIIKRIFVMGTTTTTTSRASQPNDRSDPRLRIDAVLYGGQHGVCLQQCLIIFPCALLLGLY